MTPGIPDGWQLQLASGALEGPGSGSSSAVRGKARCTWAPRLGWGKGGAVAIARS